MNLVKRTATAVVLLGSLFVIIQYAPDSAFFLFGLAFSAAALLEFYSLAGAKGLRPQKVLGTALGSLVLLTYYVRGIPTDAALFAAVLVSGVYFLVTINTAEKLAHFPASFVATLAGVLYVSFTLGFVFRIRLELGPPSCSSATPGPSSSASPSAGIR